jgi:hypothetical protein
LPANLSAPEPNGPGYIVSYADRFYAQQVKDPVILAASPVLPLILHSNGRSVVIYQGGKVRAEWMTVAAFIDAYRAQMQRQEDFERQRRAVVPQLP